MFKLNVFALALLSFVSAAYAATPPELSLSDGSGSTVTIDSTGAVTCAGSCSTAFVVASPGSITWSGTVGAFAVNIVSGQTKPTLPPPQINLGFLVTTGATGGTLTVKWTDTGFDGLGPATMTASNTLNGSISATYTGYVDNTNTPFGMGTTVGTIGPFTSTNSGTLTGPGPTAEPFSMTDVVTAVMGPSSSFSLAGFSLTGTPPPPLSLACASASGQAGTPYDSFLVATGGFPPYVFSISSGSLPNGLTLNPTTGEISGTPSTPGMFSFTSQVVDSSGNPAQNTVQSSCGITITSPPVPLGLNCAASTGIVGVAYSSSLVATGGVMPYTFTIISGSLPTGLSLNPSSGAITGVPTTAGPFPFTAQVMDSSGGSSNTVTASCGITISGPPTASCVVINAVQGVAITPVTLTGSGGAGGPYTFTATGLPAGLTMSASGTISGTPTVSGTFSYMVTVKDSAGNTGTVNCSVTVNAPPTASCVSITAVQGFPITPVTLSGSGGVGGPYTFTATGLPPGLSISSSGTISGTPTTSGTFPYTVTVTDSAGNTGTFNCSVTVNGPPTATCVSITAVQGFPIAPVTLSGSGGVGGPYTFTATGLPPGLSISSGGTISGTPTSSGTFSYTVTVTDSAGNTGTLNCSVTVNGPPSATCVSITAVQGFPITPVTLSGSGGVGGPYTFSAMGLPPGLSISSGGTISGTPTTSGTFPYTVTVTDSAGNKGTLNCSVTVNGPPTASCVSITAVQGFPITSVTLTGSGGVGGPYTFSATGLPLGLSISSGGTISGTPTSSGTFPYTAIVKDSAGNTGTLNCSVTVNGPPMATCVSITAVQGFPITPVTLSGSGGVGGPYTFSAMGLPPGLSISSGGAISGTPTTSGTFPYTVTITDSAGNKGTLNCSVTVNGPPSATCVSITAVQGFPITSVTLTGSGGVGGPYTFSATGLPPGLSISSGGAISGTPTSSGTFPYTVTITDSAGNKGTLNCSVTVNGPPTASCVVINAVQGVAITPVTMVGSGGVGGPYTFTATGLPAGLTLSASGTVSGTPTVSGTFPYTVTVTDSAGNKGTFNCSVTVQPPLSLACSAINSGTVGVAFNSGPMTVTGGTAPYTFSIASGALPSGLSLNTSTGAITGTPTTTGSFTIKVTDAKGSVAAGTCGFTITAPSNICGLTWGYWKNHVSLWPVTSLVLGSQTYSQTELTNLLGLAVAGDASINLAHQLIAAKFNVLVGTNPATAGGAITAADSILSTFSGKLPYDVAASSTVGSQMTTIAGQLDNFNSDGSAQPGCSAGPAPLTITCASGTGQVNVVYSSSVVGAGGLQPYTFSIISGSLPPGLSLNATTGAITGTPTTAGTSSYTVRLADATAVPGSSAGTITSQCSITIAPVAQALTIKCPGGSATLGSAYSSSTVASGGTAPYSYSVASGALPSGLNLNTSTGAITGTPSKSGTYTFTLKAVDSKGVSATTTGCSIAVAGGIKVGQFTTYTQGGWGAPPHGGNAGALLTAQFASVYTGGSVSVGGTYKLTFNSALSIINFLPQGGTPGQLTANGSNPTTSAAGVLAGQVLALQLNVDFSNKGITPAGFGNLHIVSGLAAGLTVSQALTQANSYLGGALLPSGVTLSDITAIIDSVNSNFDGGTTNNGYLQ